MTGRLYIIYTPRVNYDGTVLYMISYNLFKVSLFWVPDHQLFLVGALCFARAIFAAALDVVSATVARSSVLAGTRLRVA